MHPFAQDLRYALRAFGRTPVFTVAAVLSIAIGVGANTAIFSVASALLLRPLPYPDAGRLAILAVGLASIGAYGVMAYVVSQGKRDLAIRIALGATPRRILMRVVGQGMAVGIPGIAIGLASAFVATRFMRTLLFGVEATDPLTYVSAATLLTAIAFAASGFPARRAARVDPVGALKGAE